MVRDHHVNNNDVLLLHPEQNLDDVFDTNAASFDTAEVGSNNPWYQQAQHAAYEPEQRSPWGHSDQLMNVFDMLDRLDDVEEDLVLMDSLRANPLHVVSDACSSIDIFKKRPTGTKQPHLPKVRFASVQHPGNNRFYIEISLHRQRFMEAFDSGNEMLCNEIATNIVRTVTLQSYPPGRFLEYDPLGSSVDWIDIGQDQAAIERVKGALREPPEVHLSKFLYHENATSAGLSEECDKLQLDVKDGHNTGKNTVDTSMSTNDITLQIDHLHHSRTISLPSHRESYRSTSYTNSHIGTATTSIMSNSPVYEEEDSDSDNPKSKKKSFIRRRGMLSSGKKKKTSFHVNDDLTRLVQSVFNQPIDDGCVSDEDSECSASSGLFHDDMTKRRKHAHSICSSASSLNGLRGDFANDLRIEPRSSASRKISTSSTSGKRKKISPAAASSTANSIKQDFFNVQVKCTDANGSTHTRPLSRYDILCTNHPHLGILLCNQVGNNRLRIMLQIHQARYNSKDIILRDKNRIIFDILQRSKGSFVLQDQKNTNLWTQTADGAVPKIIKTSLEECTSNPTLPTLPSHRESPWLQGGSKERRRSKQVTMDDLHAAAVKNIKRRRGKKTIAGRDLNAIAKLQSAVLKKAAGRKTTVEKR